MQPLAEAADTGKQLQRLAECRSAWCAARTCTAAAGLGYTTTLAMAGSRRGARGARCRAHQSARPTARAPRSSTSASSRARWRAGDRRRRAAGHGAARQRRRRCGRRRWTRCSPPAPPAGLPAPSGRHCARPGDGLLAAAAQRRWPTRSPAAGTLPADARHRCFRRGARPLYAGAGLGAAGGDPGGGAGRVEALVALGTSLGGAARHGFRPACISR